jgi:hypothetical protein
MTTTDNLASDVAEALSRLFGSAWGSCCSCSYSSCQATCLRQRRRWNRRNNRGLLRNLMLKRARVVQFEGHPTSRPFVGTALPEDLHKQADISEQIGVRPAKDGEVPLPMVSKSGLQVPASMQARCHSTLMGSGGSCAQIKLSCRGRRNQVARMDCTSCCGGPGNNRQNGIGCPQDIDSRSIQADNGPGGGLTTTSEEGSSLSVAKPFGTTVGVSSSSSNYNKGNNGPDNGVGCEVPAGPSICSKSNKDDGGSAIGSRVETSRGFSLPSGATAAQASPIEIIGQVLSSQPLVGSLFQC